MLKLNATVWQQKLNTEDIGGQDMCPKKDSQEGLKLESSRQKETGKAKMTLRKTLEWDFKKMKRTWGKSEREAKDKISWRKRNSCIILKGRIKEENTL